MTGDPCEGQEIKAACAYGRQNTALYELTKLSSVPAISDGVNLEALRSLRNLPMEGEQQLMWAVQDGGFAATRQILPEWIAHPIALKLFKWTHERHSWDQKREQRHDGLLTPAMQKKYDEWKSQTSEFRFLFSIKKESQVTHVSDPRELRRNRQDIFLVSVLPHEDVAQMKLRANDGEERRLVALRGKPIASSSPTPEFLRKPLSEEEAETLQVDEFLDAHGDGMDDEAGLFV